MPNNEPEQAHKDMKNAMVVDLCGGKLHYASLENFLEILDLGTGTGIWAIDSKSHFTASASQNRWCVCNLVEDEYPSASVLGIDVSPIQPVWAPPNVKFTVDNFEGS